MTPAPAGKKVLHLVLRDGKAKRITIPEEWKVTFGPLVPGAKDGTNGSSSTALRLWSGKKGAEIQHAVFTNVESFRDMSIEIMEEHEDVRQETYVKQGDEEGEAIRAEVRVKKWVNPDELKDTRTTATEAAPGRLINQVRGFG